MQMQMQMQMQCQMQMQMQMHMQMKMQMQMWMHVHMHVQTRRLCFQSWRTNLGTETHENVSYVCNRAPVEGSSMQTPLPHGRTMGLK